jgi:hypothetical protein
MAVLACVAFPARRRTRGPERGSIQRSGPDLRWRADHEQRSRGVATFAPEEVAGMMEVFLPPGAVCVVQDKPGDEQLKKADGVDRFGCGYERQLGRRTEAGWSTTAVQPPRRRSAVLRRVTRGSSEELATKGRSARSMFRDMKPAASRLRGGRSDVSESPGRSTHARSRNCPDPD